MTLGHRWKQVLFVVLFLGMITLGFFANRQPAPPNATDPQNLLQLFRDGVPRDLQVMLPLQKGDQLRLVGYAPVGVKLAAFWIDPHGQCHALTPLAEKQVAGSVVQVDYPPMESFSGPTEPGLHTFLLLADPNHLPMEAEVRKLWIHIPITPPSGYLLTLLTRDRVELLHPKGFPLPKPYVTQPFVELFKSRCQKLADRFAFVKGTVVPVE